MTPDEPNPPPPQPLTLMDFRDRCPDCDVGVGGEHEYDEYDGGCDVAQCLVTGRQRLMCDLDHDCGRDAWTGWSPGHQDCERLGWMIGPGFPDMLRLYTHGVWDAQNHRWTAPATP